MGFTTGVALVWGNAGSTYYAVKPETGRIVALLYHTEEQPGYEGGPDGELTICPADWFYVMADDPNHHIGLINAPVLHSEMTDDEIAEANEIALGETTDAVMAELAKRN